MKTTKLLSKITILALLVFAFIIQWYLIEHTSNDFIGNWLTTILGYLACLIINSKKWQ